MEPNLSLISIRCSNINGIFGRSTGLAHLKTIVKLHPLEIICQIIMSCDDIQYYIKKWLF